MNYFDQERIFYYPFIINNSIFHTLNAAVLRTIVVRLLFMIPFFSTNVIFGELTALSEREGLRKNTLSPLEILQNCLTPIGNCKVKNQDPWKFHMVFS